VIECGRIYVKGRPAINVTGANLAHIEIVLQLFSAESEQKYENFTKHPTTWLKLNQSTIKP